MRRFAVTLAALLLAACATVPDSIGALPWRDEAGDRGVGVRDRDWVQCAEAVETHRSALSDCMARKGWTH